VTDLDEALKIRLAAIEADRDRARRALDRIKASRWRSKSTEPAEAGGAVLFWIVGKWRATADEDGPYCLAIPL
jgi:hypothetical protein